MERHGIEYPSARVEGGEADRLYEITAYPRTFLISRSGKLLWGGHPFDLQDEWIELALDQEP